MTATLTTITRFVSLSDLKAEAARAAALVSSNQSALMLAKSELAAANRMLAGTRKDAMVREAIEKVSRAQRALRAAQERQTRAVDNLPPTMRAVA